MNNVIKNSVSAIAAAIALAGGSVIAQENPVNPNVPPDYLPPPETVPGPPDREPLQPDLQRDPVRPEQVEEAVEEAVSPSPDPSTPTDDGSSLDTDVIGNDSPSDDRIAEERIDSTLEEDDSVPTDTAEDPSTADSQEEDEPAE